MTTSEWAEVRLRYLAEVNPRIPARLRSSPTSEVSFLPMESIGEDGSFDGSNLRPVAEVLNGYSFFEDDDVLFAKVTPCFENGKAALVTGLAEGAGFGTTEVTVVRARHGVESRFLFYVVTEDRFKQLGKSEMTGAGGLKRVPESFTKSYRIMLPPVTEQRAIVEYLDRETAEIDAFIADQEELIALLNERKRSAPYTSFGRLGGVPRVSLRHIYKQSRESNRPDLTVLSVYRDIGVIPKASRTDNHNKTPEDVSRYLVVRPGYLVVNKMKAWQGSVGVSDFEGIVSPDYEVLIPTASGFRDSYLHLALRAPESVADYGARSIGIRPSQWRLYWGELRDITVPAPSLAEQDDVVAAICEETAEIDAAISDAREAIALSKERRAAVISAAVTGKIDVRDHAKSVGTVGAA